MFINLSRRGFNLGTAEVVEIDSDIGDVLDQAKCLLDWTSSQAITLKGLCNDAIGIQSDALNESAQLYRAVLDQQECDLLLDEQPYRARLSTHFEALGSSFNEGDEQEIETLMFDAVAGDKTLAEDLWIKISWLSFYENDESLRFRFSFGVDFEEDVAADRSRQRYAADLTEAVFPESVIITGHQPLNTILCGLLNCETIDFVERIIYFNAPEGGAYLHHDRERGHAGVVYAQLTGCTYWLALAKHVLIDEINLFIRHCVENNDWPTGLEQPLILELIALHKDQQTLSVQLESFSNSALTHLINEVEPFIQQLIQHGYGHLLQPGDVILLPQEDERSCCWHSVFNIGDDAGQALSFAIRAGAANSMDC